MKTVTATDANREFSQLLDRVAKGEVIGITKRGKIVAVLNPANDDAKLAEAEAYKRDHLAMLRARPLLGASRGTRDELYDD